MEEICDVNMAKAGFRIPKDGGVIPTMMKHMATRWANAAEMFQNPEGWGCDSHTWAGKSSSSSR